MGTEPRNLKFTKQLRDKKYDKNRLCNHVKFRHSTIEMYRNWTHQPVSLHDIKSVWWHRRNIPNSSNGIMIIISTLENLKYWKISRLKYHYSTQAFLELKLWGDSVSEDVLCLIYRNKSIIFYVLYKCKRKIPYINLKVHHGNNFQPFAFITYSSKISKNAFISHISVVITCGIWFGVN